MKFVGLAFIFVAYATLKAMIFANAGIPSTIDFEDLQDTPMFDLPENLYDFVGVGGANSISEATENVAIAIGDTGRVILAVIIYIFDIIVYIGTIIAFLVSNTFTGIEGAPAYVNILIAIPGLLMIGIIIFKLARSGDDDA